MGAVVRLNLRRRWVHLRVRPKKPKFWRKMALFDQTSLLEPISTRPHRESERNATVKGGVCYVQVDPNCEADTKKWTAFTRCCLRGRVGKSDCEWFGKRIKTCFIKQKYKFTLVFTSPVKRHIRPSQHRGPQQHIFIWWWLQSNPCFAVRSI